MAQGYPGIMMVQLQNGAHGQACQGAQDIAATDEVASHPGPHAKALLQAQDKVAVVEQDREGHKQVNCEKLPHPEEELVLDVQQCL